jgi:ribonuclease D
MQTDFIYIRTEAELIGYLGHLRYNGISKIALDLEGDQGSIHYEYAISIFQVFDGLKPAIIDVLVMDKVDVLKEFLESEEFTKVMFACSNDQFMAQNVLDCTIRGIRDIAVAQKLLNQPINIAEYIGIDKKDKDHNQRANWIRRPISDDLLEYAINDVLDLMRVEEQLCEELEAKNFMTGYLRGCADLSKQNFRANPLHLYSRRIGSYKYMKPDKKELLRTVWIVRELIGKRLDKPVGHLFSKKVMPFWIRKRINIPEEIQHLVNKKLPPEKQLSLNDMMDLWDEAGEMAIGLP